MIIDQKMKTRYRPQDFVFNENLIIYYSTFLVETSIDEKI